MEIGFKEDYKEIDFPQKNINPKDKGFNYCLQYCKALYNAYNSGNTFLSSSKHALMEKLRLYGDGKQDVTKYMEHVLGIKTNDVEYYRKGYDNLSKHLASIMYNLNRTIENLLMKYEEDVCVNCVDDDSRSKELTELYEAMVDIREGEWLNNMYSLISEDYSNNFTAFPTSITNDELEQFYNAGGFKLSISRVAEKFIKMFEVDSKWEDNLKFKLIHDLKNYNFACARVEYNDNLGKIEYKYTDPLSFGIQKSENEDFSDAEYAFSFRFETVNTLIEKGVPLNILKDAVKRYSGLFGNKVVNVYDNDADIRLFGNSRVIVMDAVWIDTDIIKMAYYRNVYGKERSFEVDFDYMPDISEKQQKRGVSMTIVPTYEKYLYHAKHIIGVDYVFDYGKMPNQIRKNIKEVKLPYIVIRGFSHTDAYTGSLVESLIPFLEGFATAWLRFQNNKNKAVEAGIMVNLRLLANLKYGGADLSEPQAIEMFKNSHILPYLDVASGMGYTGGEVTPIKFFDGNFSTLITSAISDMEFNLGMISKVSGIPLEYFTGLNDGSNRESTLGNSASDLLNIFKTQVRCLFNIKKNLAELGILLVKGILRYYKNAQFYYSNSIGEDDVKIISLLDTENPYLQFGMYLESRATDEEKLRLLEVAKSMITKTQDSLTPHYLDTYLYIEELLYSGANIKEIRMRIMFLLKKIKEEEQRKEQIKYQATAEANTMPIRAEAEKQLAIKQADMQIEKMKADNVKEVELLKSNINYIKALEDAIKASSADEVNTEIENQNRLTKKFENSDNNLQNIFNGI